MNKKELVLKQERGKSIQVFSENKRVSSGLIMIDPDAPFPERPDSFPHLHWMAIESIDRPEVAYESPHPPWNSNPHRYIVYQVAFRSQEAEQAFIRAKHKGEFLTFSNHRSSFDIASFLWEKGLRIMNRGMFHCC